MTVAIVDNEMSVRRALARLLRIAGMQVVTFGSPLLFLEALAFRPVDCVLLDLHLGEMTGFDVQKRLHQIETAPPVIILTSNDSAECRASALLNGASAYLVKPVDSADLLLAIARAVSGCI